MSINKDFDDFLNKKTDDAEIQLKQIYDVLGKDFVLALVENTKKARKKYPVFAHYEEQKLEILQEEYEEVRQAFYTETMERTKEGLLDVGTVLSRWYNGE